MSITTEQSTGRQRFRTSGRNFDRPCEYWFQEIVDGEERNRKERAWVYLSR